MATGKSSAKSGGKKRSACFFVKDGFPAMNAPFKPDKQSSKLSECRMIPQLSARVKQTFGKEHSYLTTSKAGTNI